MRRNGPARRNPLVQDPSTENTPDIQLEVVRLVVEYDANPGAEITDYGDFELRMTMYGNYEAFFSRVSDRRPFIWGSNSGRWFPTAQMWIFIDRNNPIVFARVERKQKETFYMLQYNGNTLRVYELREVRKRRVRRNPLVQDPSMTNTPNLQLEVARLAGEYYGDEETRITEYDDFYARTSRYGLYEVAFAGEGYRSWAYWSPGANEWYESARRWLRIDDGETDVVRIPNEPVSYYLLQRIGDTLSVYELREVTR